MTTPTVPGYAPGEPLTLHALASFAAVADAVVGEQRIIRTTDDGGVLRGTARCFTNETGVVLNTHADVRSAYLRVTTEHGAEVLVPVADLARDYARGAFRTHDWSAS